MPLAAPELDIKLNGAITLVGSGSGMNTGLSRYAGSLHKAMTALGLNVEVVPSLSAPVPNIAVKAAKRLRFDLASFFRTYPVRLPKSSGQLLHLTSQNQASAAALFGPSKKVKLVVTVHDLITQLYRHEPELTSYMKFYDRAFDDLTIRGLKKATILIADSEHTRRDVINGLGFPAERVVTVPIGVDHNVFKPQTVGPEFYQRFNLPTGHDYVLYVGSEDPRKNLRRLIEAFARVVAEYPNARLLKVGAARFAAERAELTALIERLGLTDKVLLVDRASDADLAQFYSLARLFVFPSLYEGFGLPPLEALACGTSVISSNSSSLPEVVGEAARLVDPYDVAEIAAAISHELASEPSPRRREMGLAQAARFTWESTARQTLAVYQQVLERD